MSATPPPLGPGEIDMDEIARLIRAADMYGFVEHTGGGGAATPPEGEPLPNFRGDLRYPASAGPGRFLPDSDSGRFFGYAQGQLDDFAFGPDDDGDATPLTATQIGVSTPAQAAAVLIAQVLTPGRVLSLAEARQAAAHARFWSPPHPTDGRSPDPEEH